VLRIIVMCVVLWHCRFATCRTSGMP